MKSTKVSRKTITKPSSTTSSSTSSKRSRRDNGAQCRSPNDDQEDCCPDEEDEIGTFSRDNSTDQSNAVVLDPFLDPESLSSSIRFPTSNNETIPAAAYSSPHLARTILTPRSPPLNVYTAEEQKNQEHDDSGDVSLNSVDEEYARQLQAMENRDSYNGRLPESHAMLLAVENSMEIDDCDMEDRRRFNEFYGFFSIAIIP